MLKQSIKADGARVIEVQGFDNIDASMIRELERNWIKLNIGNEKHILDMHNIKFIDSTGIQFLIKTTKNNKNFSICNVHRSVSMLLDLLKAKGVLSIYDSVEEALSA